jgi:hypothetical protein
MARCHQGTGYGKLGRQFHANGCGESSGRCGRTSPLPISAGRRHCPTCLACLSQRQVPNALKQLSEFRLRRQAHGSIRIQEGQPLCRGLPGFVAWSHHSSRIGRIRRDLRPMAFRRETKRRRGRLHPVNSGLAFPMGLSSVPAPKVADVRRKGPCGEARELN